MVGEWIRFGFCAFFVLAGLTAVVTATVGVLRFRDPLCEMHAAAMIDTLALLSFVLASAVMSGFGIETVKMAAVVIFMWMTSPINSHLLSRLEYIGRDRKGEDEIELPSEETGDDGREN